MTENYRQGIERITRRLASSADILFITGAGLSAESGLPTYRGIGGLYNDKLTDADLPIEVVLSGSMMASKPELTWQHIAQIEKTCRGAKHNRAHTIIADIEKKFKRTWVLTQNIDGFHGDAGSNKLIEIHGSIRDLVCTSCRYRTVVSDFSELSIPPLCPDCNAMIRPDVVLFGEMLPFKQTEILSRELRTGFDVIFSIGTTSVFPYISGPIYEGIHSGALTIEINPGFTEVSRAVDVKLESGAVQALEDIWAGLAT